MALPLWRGHSYIAVNPIILDRVISIKAKFGRVIYKKIA
jgi:hypothetical protein